MPLDDGSSEGGGSGRSPSRNVLGERLEACSTKPVTGFFRNGCCDTGPADRGSHTVCGRRMREHWPIARSPTSNATRWI
jgi:uncharacterized protein (DUF2237 family)